MNNIFNSRYSRTGDELEDSKLKEILIKTVKNMESFCGQRLVNGYEFLNSDELFRLCKCIKKLELEKGKPAHELFDNIVVTGPGINEEFKNEEKQMGSALKRSASLPTRRQAKLSREMYNPHTGEYDPYDPTLRRGNLIHEMFNPRTGEYEVYDPNNDTNF